MQLIAEAYDLLRRGRRHDARRDRRDLRAVEQGRPRVVPDRDHRRSAAATDDPDDRQAAGRRHRSTPPGRRAPAPGPCRPPSTWASRCPASPRRSFARGLSASGPARRAAAGAAGAGGQSVGGPTDQLHRGRPDALYASKIVAYAQGLDVIAARRRRVRLGHQCRCGGPDLARRLHHPGAVPEPDHRGVPRTIRTWRRCCSRRTSRTLSRRIRTPGAGWSRSPRSGGIPIPGFARRPRLLRRAALARLPAALIQGQRDFFGAHTYQRVDRDGAFHTRWSGRPR